MLKFFSMFLALMGLFAHVAFANVGVFSGYGHTIELSKSEEIQMVSEEVEIIPGRGRFLFNGGVPGMDRVEYKCKFKLKNLKNKDMTIRVGFSPKFSVFKTSLQH